MRRKKPYHHGDLRRALLDATLALAVERGAAGVTLREAARVAGVSQTAPYRHFADKDAMLAAASEEGFRLLHRRMLKALAAAPAAARVATPSTVYFRFALDHVGHFRLMFGHGSPPKSATPALQQAAREVFQLTFTTLVAHLPPRTGERAARQALSRIWALTHGAAVLALEKQILFDVGARALVPLLHDGIRRLIREEPT